MDFIFCPKLIKRGSKITVTQGIVSGFFYISHLVLRLCAFLYPYSVAIYELVRTAKIRSRTFCRCFDFGITSYCCILDVMRPLYLKRFSEREILSILDHWLCKFWIYQYTSIERVFLISERTRSSRHCGRAFIWEYWCHVFKIQKNNSWRDNKKLTIQERLKF